MYCSNFMQFKTAHLIALWRFCLHESIPQYLMLLCGYSTVTTDQRKDTHQRGGNRLLHRSASLTWKALEMRQQHGGASTLDFFS